MHHGRRQRPGLAVIAAVVLADRAPPRCSPAGLLTVLIIVGAYIIGLPVIGGIAWLADRKRPG